MKSAKVFMIIIMCAILIPELNCSRTEREVGEESEHAQAEEGEHSSRESGEHASREAGEHAQGEESGIRYTLSETCEEVRKGVQLHLIYDQSTSTFIGTIKNTSNETAKSVRIEVHLSNKVELGPTTPVDLAPGIESDVNLSAEGQSFEWWTAHAEVGNSEH
ncbi:hypothetical protein ACFL6I_03655 [candidate division KSB1 bacterium]